MSTRAITAKTVRARLRWVLAFMAAWAIVFSMSLAAGVAPAYANGDSSSAASDAPATSLNAAGDASAAPLIAAGTDPAAPQIVSGEVVAISGAGAQTNNATSASTTPNDASTNSEASGGKADASKGAANDATTAGASATSQQESPAPKSASTPTASANQGAIIPLTLENSNDKAAEASELNAASGTNWGDDGTGEAYIAIEPTVANGRPFDYGSGVPADYDPYNSASNPFYPDDPYRVYSDGAEHVFLYSRVGWGVDLAASVPYVRIGDAEYEYSDVSLASPNGIFGMISWYDYQIPFGEGTYWDDLDKYAAAHSGASSGSGAGMPSYESYNVSALAYIYEHAYTWSEETSVPNRIYFEASNQSSASTISLPWWSSIGGSGSCGLYFDYPSGGLRTIVAQATIVEEFMEMRTDEAGTPYEYYWHILHASKPVVFHIYIEPAPTTTLVLDIKDDSGNPIDATSYTDWYVSLYKDYTGSGYGSMAYCLLSSNTQYDCATAGTYSLSIRHALGGYKAYQETFTIEEPDFMAACYGTGSIVKEIVLEAIAAPVLHSVTFVDEDDTVLLAVKSYNKGTVGSRVETPATRPTKEEDEDYKYVFSRWEVVGSGGRQTSGWTPFDVTEDVVYKAVYKGIPKKNVTTVAKVYASGGLFGKPKPAGVVSYGLSGSEITGDEKATWLADYSDRITGDVVGVFRVDLIQYNESGEEINVYEGVGDMKLSFQVDGLSEGAKVRAIQIHSDGVNPPEVIEHTGLTVVGGAVDITLNDKLSVFIIMKDDGSDTYRHMFDDGTDDVFIGLTPVPYGDYAASAIPGADGKKAVVVPIEVALGEGLDLGVMTDYIRVGDKESTGGEVGPISMTITEDSTDQDPWNYMLFSWYMGESPLAQGTYYSNLDAYKKATGSESAGSAHALPTYEAVDISAMAYIWQSAYYGFNNGSEWEYYNVPNRLKYTSYNGVYGSDGSYMINVPVFDTVTAAYQYELFFQYPTTYVITAQVTLVKEIIDSLTDEGGNPYNFVSHILYASVPVEFVITVVDAPRTSLVVEAVDELGNPVDISDYSNFEVSMHKQYANVESTRDDEIADLYYPGDYYAYASWGDRYDDLATAGKYKIIVSHKTGLYEDYVGTFWLTDEDIAGATSGTFTKTIELQSVAAPTQYSVKFLDDSGNLITPPGEQLYNENTHWSVVTKPTTNPACSTPDTDDVMYVFWYWVRQGTTTTAPDKVVDNLVMVPYYKEVPKKDKLVTPRVYASGGLFTKAKDPGVASHALTATVYDLTSSEAKVIISGHSSVIGDSAVLGMFDVGITRYKTDGTEESVTEGVGALGLTFDLSGSGVADGTRVKVIQIHKKDVSSPEEIIEHTGTVVGGSVSITLDDKLSTFIFLKEVEAQGEDPTDPTDPTSGEDPADDPADDPTPGDDINDDVDIEPSNPSSDNPSSDTPSSDTPASEEPENETPAKEEPSTSNDTPSQASNDVEDFINNGSSDDEAATRGVPSNESKVGEGGLNDDGAGLDVAENVKAGSAPDNGKTMPQTDDSWGPLALALVVICALSAVFGAAACRGRRRDAER